MTDRHQNTTSTPSKPTEMFDITPADSDLAVVAHGLRVYCTDVVSFRVTPLGVADDSYVTLTFPAGLWIEPCAIKRVWNTGLSGTPTLHGYT